MPDLFFCHNNNAMELGADSLLDWQDVFTTAELANYVPSFLEDGMVEGHLSVFPISKSTHLLFIAGTQFARFSAETGVTYDDLATWEGFFAAAETYYTWSGGKPFCALDYPIRMVELYALEKGATELYTDEGWYDFSEPLLQEGWNVLADALVKGHVIMSDLYSNTQVMTNGFFTHMQKKQSLRRKLFWHMLFFAVLLLLMLLITLSLLGTFTGTRDRIASLMQFQMAVFEQQIDTYFDNLAVMSVQLSETLTAQIDRYLTDNDVSILMIPY